MDSFRARRHTTILALVAIAVSAGIFTWSFVTIAGLSADPRETYAANGFSAFVASAVVQSNDAAKSDFSKTGPAAIAQPQLLADRLAAAVMPAPANVKSFGWQTDLEWLGAQPAHSVQALPPEMSAWQAAALPHPAAPAIPDQPAPLPAPQLAALSQPPVADPDDQAPITAGVRAARHPPRLHKAEPAQAAAPKPHKVAANGQRSYTEKIVEQGDSGGVSFRYRKRTCTPGNMVDVCYMPEADRQKIVIERY